MSLLKPQRRIWDLSQNVDRFTDSAPAGITTCITPKGAFYITTRGGPLLGIEALALQGLPIDKLLLTRESNSNLHDLAGNAMTSTVVGAAILSALIAGYEALESDDDEVMEGITDETKNQVNEPELSHRSITYDAKYDNSNLAILDDVERSSRLCACEGGSMTLRYEFKRCKLCGHTACHKCAGNPSHDYATIADDEIKSRIPPKNFEKSLKDSLPMILQLSGLTIRELQDLIAGQKPSISDTILRSFSEHVIQAIQEPLRFSSTQRSSHWTIQYISSSAKAELVFESGKPVWKVYATASAQLSANHVIRKLLAHPFARMKPISSNLLYGNWQISLPVMSKSKIRIEKTVQTLPSWEMRLGLQGKAFRNKEIPQGLRIQCDVSGTEEDVRGVYKILPNCGTATSSLYKRSDPTMPKLFLFLDPEHTSDANKDCFIFSRSIEPIKYGHKREALVRLDSAWRPSICTKNESVPGIVEYCWIGIPSLTFDSSMPSIGQLSSPGPEFRLTTETQTCHASNAILHFVVNSPQLGPTIVSSSYWTVIKSFDKGKFLAEMAWLFERTSNLSNLEEWQPVKSFSTDVCLVCTPALPKVTWVRSPRTDAIIVMEEPQSAARYERVLKSRPPVFLLQTRKDENGRSHVRLSINVLTLAHRAQANLSQKGSSLEQTCRLISNGSTTFRLVPYVLLNNRNDERAQNPPHFKLPLREEQQRSLSWMIKQEHPDLDPFVVEEVEEEILPQIGWRAEGRATKTIRVLGGLLADEVGYGKTATTLALIDSQASSIHLTPFNGKIPLRATLILAPYHLLQQWRAEISKFMGDTYNVECINTFAILSKMTIKKFKSADIILTTWNILENEGYLSRFMAMTNSHYKPKGARAVTTWYEECLHTLGDHVELLKHRGPNELEKVLRGGRTRSDEGIFDYEPSRRFKGKQYEADSKKRLTKYRAAKRKTNELDIIDEANIKIKKPEINLDEIISAFGLDTISVENVKSPLFQMFHFNRIILDEYSYLAGEDRVYVMSLSARSKFALSGTPPLGDFAEVKRIAMFLGLPIGADNISPGFIKASSIKSIQKEYISGSMTLFVMALIL